MTTTDNGQTIPALTTENLCSHEEWQSFFSRFSHFVLVANSDDQTLDAIRSSYPDTALFIFFNRVNKVLKEPFVGNSILVTRSNQAGSELVYRDILGQMVALLPAPGFLGVMNMRTVEFERLMEPSQFKQAPAGTLDLAEYFHDLYPQEHTASSGFAMALWLYEHVPASKIVLTGFSATRGKKWKLFLVHDWVFEQSVLNLLAINDRLEFSGKTVRNPYARLLQRFPDLKTEDVLFASLQTLSMQLEGNKRHIDRLISVTAPLRFLYDGFKAMKRKSKKDRILAAERK
ncbi:3-deoxy-manno-octulosonate cytidylyltransferase [Rhizobium wenxiniae]|uniref:3-deoxy-manno-octulosonate cytidylyltransferase n=1 Tax=Rhizobium wenxiniae TaxID=1737357 RepID=A0A7W9Y307_9HYPH|nr:3-deoxy-manno-octulosonate cytidylyltransferase [Rhizobium wenxiniae]MBB6160970.1 hypothetical protein [Rhizobium wenxiniae]GGF85393.1 3-deoxy-manno-octulosonate cytidylyltransferase [Rhizobium wenxiniae]